MLGNLLVDPSVEPILPPALHGVDELQTEVASVVADLNLQAANGIGAVTPVIGPHLENGLQ